MDILRRINYCCSVCVVFLFINGEACQRDDFYSAIKCSRNEYEGKDNQQCPPYYDMDIQEAWSLNYTGVGVTVAVVDTGVEVNHIDIRHNINTALSYNFVNNTTGVTPQRFRSYPSLDKWSNHGNAMIGLIGAEKGNDIYSAGVAFNSSVVALRVFYINEIQSLKRKITVNGRSNIGRALSYHKDDIDIYSCSFAGPIFTKLNPLVDDAIETGAREGRHDKGSIYVFPSGDNDQKAFDCNTDSFANNINTITVSAVGVNGSIPGYAIPCACITVSAFGEGNTFSSDKLETLFHDDRNTSISGTSPATALVSGILALVLQANPNLTGRDVQYLLVVTSSLDLLGKKDLIVPNGAGLKYHPYFGYGLINATALVLNARVWKLVPKQLNVSTSWTGERSRFFRNMTQPGDIIHLVNVTVDPCPHNNSCISRIEHVVADVILTSKYPKLIQLDLCSPLGTCSRLLHKRRGKNAKYEHVWFKRWNFTSIQFWGECPIGEWKLMMKQNHRSYKKLTAELDFAITDLKLIIFGAQFTPLSCPTRGVDDKMLSDYEEVYTKTRTTPISSSTPHGPSDLPGTSNDTLLIFIGVGFLVGLALALACMFACMCKRQTIYAQVPT